VSNTRQWGDVVGFFAQCAIAPDLPIEVSMPDGEILLFLRVFRFLKGKRIVLLAKYKNRQVVIKLFLGKRAWLAQKKDLNGVEAFQLSGLRTPAVVCDNYRDAKLDGRIDCRFVMFEYLEDALSLQVFFELCKNEKLLEQRVREVSIIIASLHMHGKTHEDIHLDNLVICNDDLYIIDGGGVKSHVLFLSSRSANNNLAKFMSILYPAYDRFIGVLLSAYLEKTEGKYYIELNNFIMRVLIKRKRRERFVLKCLRNCTNFRVEKGKEHFLSIAKKYDNQFIRQIMNNPESHIESGNVFKKGSTNTLAIITLEKGERFLIKKYKSTKGLMQKYLRRLLPSRARTSWKNMHLMKMLGILTPAPVAMLEIRKGPFVLVSYVVSEYLESEHAMDYFSKSRKVNTNWPVLVKSIGQILLTMKNNYIYHGDLKGNNILISDYKVYLIDFDSMISYKRWFFFRGRLQKDQKRFVCNWQNNEQAWKFFKPIVEQWVDNKVRNW